MFPLSFRCCHPEEDTSGLLHSLAWRLEVNRAGYAKSREGERNLYINSFDN